MRIYLELRTLILVYSVISIHTRSHQRSSPPTFSLMSHLIPYRNEKKRTNLLWNQTGWSVCQWLKGLSLGSRMKVNVVFDMQGESMIFYDIPFPPVQNPWRKSKKNKSCMQRILTSQPNGLRWRQTTKIDFQFSLLCLMKWIVIKRNGRNI